MVPALTGAGGAAPSLRRDGAGGGVRTCSR